LMVGVVQEVELQDGSRVLFSDGSAFGVCPKVRRLPRLRPKTWARVESEFWSTATFEELEAQARAVVAPDPVCSCDPPGTVVDLAEHWEPAINALRQAGITVTQADLEALEVVVDFSAELASGLRHRRTAR
jgi:hypothetical protein